MIEIVNNVNLFKRFKNDKVTLDEIKDLIVEQASFFYKESYEDGFQEGTADGFEEGYTDGKRGNKNMRDLQCEDNPHTFFFSEINDILEAFKADKLDFDALKNSLSQLVRSYQREGFSLGYREGYEEYYLIGFEKGEEDETSKQT